MKATELVGAASLVALLLPPCSSLPIFVTNDDLVFRREIFLRDPLHVGGGHRLQAGNVRVDSFGITITHRRFAQRRSLAFSSLAGFKHVKQQKISRLVEFGGSHGFGFQFFQFGQRRLLGVVRRLSACSDNRHAKQPGVIAEIGIRTRLRRDLLLINERLIQA